MIDALRFVQGAVAKKDFVPEMTHFHIQDGGVVTYNGAMTLFSPIGLDFNASPKADQMIKTLSSCRGDTITLHMTPSGKLSVRSGNFKGLVDCYNHTLPEFPQPTTGEVKRSKRPLLPVLKNLLPFIGEDASRPWARGILLKDSFAFATNNVILIQHWLGGGVQDIHFAPINIPRSTVIELLRIDEEPEATVVNESAVTFHFSNDRWLKAQMYPTDWPDLGRILDRVPLHGANELTEEIWDAVDQLIPLVDKMTETLYIKRSELSAGTEQGGGAVIKFEDDIFTLPDSEVVQMNIRQFSKLRGIAVTMTLTNDGPCTFTGDCVRGAIMGKRSA